MKTLYRLLAIILALAIQFPAFGQSTLRSRTATTTAAPTDIMWVVINPSGSAADRKITVANLFESISGNKMMASYASLSAAVTAISTAQAAIVIPTTTTVSASLVVPSNIELLPTGAGMISVSSGQTLDYYGPTNRWPDKQVVTGSGQLVLAGATRGVVPQWFGAKGDTKIVTDAAITGSTLTSSSAAFTSADIGKLVDVAGAGPVADLSAIVTGYTDSTHVTVSVPASYTASGQTISVDNATIATGSMTAGSAALVAGSSFFLPSDVGKLVRCTGVGAKNLPGTITGYTNSTTVTLSVSASVTVSGRKAVYGTNDQAAIAKAIIAGYHLFFPPGNYAVGSSLTITKAGVVLEGAGMFKSVLYSIGPQMLTDASTFHLLNINTPSTDVLMTRLGFSGTNWTAQHASFGVDVADGVYIDSIGPISNIKAELCRFDSFWGDGFHSIGSAGLTITASNAVKDVAVIDCQAAFNSYDGLNPNSISGVKVEGCYLFYNGTGGCEASTSNAIFSNNHCYFNRLGGLSIGGYGDPESSEAVTITGNVCIHNGQYGVALASNQCTTVVAANICRLNGVYGILAVGVSGTLATTNKISLNICDSNGRSGVGSAGIVANMDNLTVEMNTLTDRGIAGYEQRWGVLSYGNNVSLIRNYSIGNTSQDYSLQAGSVWLDNIYPNAVVFDGGIVIYYPANAASLYTLVFSATPVFDARKGSTQKITLTANVTSSTITNGVRGQRLTLMIAQDATGSRTFAFPANVLGATAIGSTASKYNVQTFVYDGSNWVATGPGQINQ